MDNILHFHEKSDFRRRGEKVWRELHHNNKLRAFWHKIDEPVKSHIDFMMVKTI